MDSDFLTPETKLLIEKRQQTSEHYRTNVQSKVGYRTFGYLMPEIQKLLINSEIMISLIRNTPPNIELGLINDFSFLVFPAAKAYEGFLKQIAIDAKFSFSKNNKNFIITKAKLEDEPDFGIGVIFNETINPQINTSLLDTKRYKNHPNFMKAIWDKCRCDILHYDFKKPVILSLAQALDTTPLIYQAIRWGFEGFINTSDFSLDEMLKSFPKLKPLVT